MAKAHHDHSPIAMPVATAVAGSLGQRLHLNLGEVFALPPLRVFRLARRNSSENWQWRRIGDKPESGCFPDVGIANSSENAYFRKSFRRRGRFTSLPLLRIRNYISGSHRRAPSRLVVRGDIVAETRCRLALKYRALTPEKQANPPAYCAITRPRSCARCRGRSSPPASTDTLALGCAGWQTHEPFRASHLCAKSPALGSARRKGRRAAHEARDWPAGSLRSPIAVH